jgi:transposase
MQYKPIVNYHMENVVLGKQFNLGVIGSFFHAFTLSTIELKNVVKKRLKTEKSKLKVSFREGE